MALFCAAIIRDSVSLLRFPFLSHVQSLYVILVWCVAWKVDAIFFFPFWFSSYCFSVISCSVCVVSDCCNQSFFALLYVVFESLYRSIDAIFNADESSSSIFSWHFFSFFLPTSSLECSALFIGMSFLVLWSIYWLLFSSTLRMVPGILRGGQRRCLSFW